MITEKQFDSKFNKTFLKEILQNWNIDFIKIVSDIKIPGSPNRSENRVVIEDSVNHLYILEEISNKNYRRKIEISSLLEELHSKKLPVIINIKDKKNNSIIKKDNSYWQLKPYIQGIELNRNTYWNDSWRGKLLADFLYKLNKSFNIKNKSSETFSIIDYIYTLEGRLKQNNIEIYNEVKPVILFLQKELFPIHNSLEMVFSHGDPHPLNIIWGDKNILAVIDWEFSGIKPIFYDLGLITGCVGLEDPNALNGDFLKSFNNKLINLGYVTSKQLKNILLFAIATRFGWLAEWIKTNDTEIIKFEIYYMKYLAQKYMEQ